MSHRGTVLSGEVVILAAMSVSPVGLALGATVMVKREYTPGRLSYIESHTEIEMDVRGLPVPPMKLKYKQLYGLWEMVESADAERTRIVLTFDRAARSAEAPMMGNVEFDTDDPEHEEAAPQLGVVLKPMIGMAMTMDVDKDGEVISFSGMDAINKKVSERAVASMHWEQMKEDFTNERGRTTWGTEPLLIYPNKKVKPGDTWKASFSVTEHVVGTIVTEYQYEVERIGTENGRKVVSISVAGVVSKGVEDKGDPEPKKRESKEEGKLGTDAAQAGDKKSDPETELSGAVVGTALYDVELGRVVERATESNVDIRIPLSKMIPNVPASEEPQFVDFKMAINNKSLVLTKEEREAQKAEAHKRAEMRRKAEEEDENEDDGVEEEDD